MATKKYNYKTREDGKNDTGRPEKYTLEYCTIEINQILATLQADKKYEYLTIQDLVRDKEYTRDCLSEWSKKFAENEDFSRTIKKIYEELENRLFKIGVSGKANAAMAIFGLKNNYGWTDKLDMTSKGEKINQITGYKIKEDSENGT